MRPTAVEMGGSMGVNKEVIKPIVRNLMKKLWAKLQRKGSVDKLINVIYRYQNTLMTRLIIHVMVINMDPELER